MSRYMTQTPQYSAQVVNAAFLNKVAADPRNAALEGTAFTRDKLREMSSFRHILPPVVLKPEEIDRREDTDQPVKIVEKEPDSRAFTMPIRGHARATYFTGIRYRIDFFRIQSVVLKKKTEELKTYQNDIRKILADNIVKDLAEQEDRYGLKLLALAANADPTNRITSGTAFNPSLFADARSSLVRRKIPVGAIWMPDAVYSEALKLSATEIGFNTVEEHYKGPGIEKEDKLFAIPVIRSIHADAFQEATGSPKGFFLVAPENFLGKFFLTTDATLFIKQEADDIEFYAYEYLGIGIGNDKSVQMIKISQP